MAISLTDRKPYQTMQIMWKSSWVFECFWKEFNLCYPKITCQNHWHVLTWIWETCLARYQLAVITVREMRAGRNLSHWINESADYLQPIKMLILSTELVQCLDSVYSFALCIRATSCSQQWSLIYDLQCILDCFPVFVSTELLYFDDQLVHSYWNPY